MYESHEVPVIRRLLVIIPMAIIVLAAIILVVWALFFHTGDKKSTPMNQHTSNMQTHKSAKSSTGTVTTPDANQPNAASTTTPSPATAPTTATPTQPTQLVNTGAGNVIGLGIFAVAAGSVAYHIRLRRKLIH